MVPEPEVSHLTISAQPEKDFEIQHVQVSTLLFPFDRSESTERPVKENSKWEELSKLQAWEGKQQRKKSHCEQYTCTCVLTVCTACPGRKPIWESLERARRSAVASKRWANLSLLSLLLAAPRKLMASKAIWKALCISKFFETMLPKCRRYQRGHRKFCLHKINKKCQSD